MRRLKIQRLPSWRHQREAYQTVRNLPGGYLIMSMGTGKSKVAIDLIMNRRDKLNLIVGPLKAMEETWPAEISKHWVLEQAGDLIISNFATEKGNLATKVAAVEARMQLFPLATHILLVNYELVWRPVFKLWAFDQSWDTIIADEIHRVKKPGGKTSMALSTMGRRAAHRLGLSGTPMPRNPLDIYAQYRFLDSSIFGTSMDRFRNRYAVMGGESGYEVIGYNNLEELHEKMYSIAYRATEEVLDLPPLVVLERTTSLEPGTLRLYQTLAKELTVATDDYEVTVANVLAKFAKLQGITGGFVKTDDGQIVRVSSAKLDLLQEVLEELPEEEPVVIFYRFRHEAVMFRERLEVMGRGCGEVSGSYNDIKAWQRGDFPVLLAQMQAASESVDFTRAAFGIYYTITSLGNWIQSQKRLHRPGQTRPTRLVQLVVKNTVDRTIVRSLRAGQEIIDYVLDHLGGWTAEEE